MSENPDNKDYVGLAGPDDEPFLMPTSSQGGMLRFVERTETNVPEGSQVRVMRILQQYQWCAKVGDFGWYDIPLVDE